MQRKSSSSVRIFYPKYDKKELVQKLKGKIGDLAEKVPLSFVVLFGSYARGKHTVSSDMDLLVVYKGKKRDNVFAIVKKTLGIPSLEPHVYSEGEYEEQRSLIGRMIEGGIVLFPTQK